jgi:hypothetical protein
MSAYLDRVNVTFAQDKLERDLGGLLTLSVILAFGAFLATRVTHDPATEVVEGERTGRFDRTPAPVQQAERLP